MKRIVVLILLVLIVVSADAQNKDTTHISITNFNLQPGTFSWRGTGTFHDMTSWDSSPYTEGHLRQGNQFRMNYRLLMPQGHDPSYRPGYPLIVMLHGAGERGNCWNDKCYCGSTCNPNDAPIDGTDPAFLNNDHNLVHGGSPHLSSRNLAGGKYPDDPTLHARAFPGFVLFPQMLNQWRNSSSPASSDVSFAIRIVRLLSKKYNIDQDRIYIHGLSMGAQAALEALNYADWLFAAAAPMSPISFQQSLEYDSVKNIPLWVFQGGKDTNPKPSQTETMVRNLREKGANVRYSLYPSLGHGTWNTAYAEPDFFSWLLSFRKSNIHVDFGNPNICATTGKGASLMLPQGFPAYQWERDGKVISGATTNTYVAAFPGVYRARFSRVSASPTDEQWNRWSDPVVVGEASPSAPVVEQSGTVVLQDLNRSSIAFLNAPEGFVSYKWFRDGNAVANVVAVDKPHEFRVNGCSSTYPCQHSGAYTLVVEGFDQCPSLPSAPAHVIFATQPTTVPRAIQNPPTAFQGTVISPTSVLLKWNDNSPDERGFEIWRRKLLNVVGEDFTKGWVMATFTGEDETVFTDTGLDPNATYYYKIRGVNNVGRSHYAPGNNEGNVNHNVIVHTLAEDTRPTPPGSLSAQATALGAIALSWERSFDLSGVSRYIIYFDTDSLLTPTSDTTFVMEGLALNRQYVFRVKAQDAGGNLSFDSNPAVAHTYAAGLYYKHTTGVWTAMSQMASTWTAPEFTGSVPAFSLQERTQEDFFNFEFSGFLYITTAGNYQFRITSDDGSQFFLNDVLIANNDGLHGSVTVTSAVQSLQPGAIPVMVRYFENNGGQSLTVQYNGPDTGNAWKTIPADALNSGTPPAAPEPPAAPTNLVATAAGMQSINLEWDYQPLKIVVLGSSTAFGTGATPIANSWVNLLTDWLNANTIGASVTNLALGGFDTYDVLPAGDPNRNITKALSLSPDIILVNLPSNDVVNNVPVATTIANLETLRDLAEAEGVTIFFTTTQPRNFGDLARRTMLQETAVLIRSTFAPYVIDIYDDLADADLRIKAVYNVDDIHVNNDGHSIIFNEARKTITPWLPSFEIQRGVFEAGPFAPIHRSLLTSHADEGLKAGTTYYYRIRTTSVDTVSAFTPVASATTLMDNESPTQPGTPVLISESYTTVSIQWAQATDNVGVSHYEILVNGEVSGISASAAFQLTGLEPGSSYSITVIAIDESGNRSVASGALTGSTPEAITYFTVQGAVKLNDLSSWRSTGGVAPSAFHHGGQYFVVTQSLPVDAAWTVEGSASRVVIDDGVTLVINAHPVNATIDVENQGRLELAHATLPQLGELSPSSTVSYTSRFIQPAAYGNLQLAASGAFTFPAGVVSIEGDLTTVDGVALKGAAGNATSLSVMGDLLFSGSLGEVAETFAVVMELAGSNQTISADGDLSLYEVRKSQPGRASLQSSDDRMTLSLGSSLGGGITLTEGAILDMQNNDLVIKAAGAVNAENETGVLAVNRGSINISTSAPHCNLYFDNEHHALSRLDIEVPGGTVQVRNSLQVLEGIKIMDGDLQSDGHITLVSTADMTANLEEIENGGTLTGALNVQRYVDAKPRTYRYLSSPVDGARISDWQQFFSITGPFVGADSGPGLGPQSSVYVYEENSWKGYPLSVNPPPYADSNAPLEKGKGYAAFIRDEDPMVLELSGVPYQGDVVYSLFPSQDGDADSGWNLLGNPYASTILWSDDTEAWQRNFASHVVAVRNNFDSTSGQFEYYDALSGTGTGLEPGGTIASGQAFWVQSLPGGTPALTITEKAKVTDQQPLLRDGGQSLPFLKLSVEQEERRDALVIVLSDAASSSRDNFDGLKRLNEGMYNFSSLTSDGVAAAINHINTDFCRETIWLHLRNADVGAYELKVESVDLFTAPDSVLLFDAFTGHKVNLREQSAYPFEVTPDVRSTSSGRFRLVLTNGDVASQDPLTVAGGCGEAVTLSIPSTTAGTTYLLFHENAELLGQTVASGNSPVEFLIPANKFGDGLNRFKLRKSTIDCPEGFLDESLSISYFHPLSVEVADVTVCEGESALVTVSAHVEGDSYVWYQSGQVITGETTQSLETAPISEDMVFGVERLRPDGCKSEVSPFTVSPKIIETPSLVFSDDTLSTLPGASSYSWFRNGVLLPNSGSYLPSPRNGRYAVMVEINGCQKWSDDLLITASEVALASFGVQVFPNPSDGKFEVHLSSGRHGSLVVSMIDATGRALLRQAVDVGDTDAFSVECSRCVGGLYYLVIEQQGMREITKVVVR